MFGGRKVDETCCSDRGQFTVVPELIAIEHPRRDKWSMSDLASEESGPLHASRMVMGKCNLLDVPSGRDVQTPCHALPRQKLPQ